jgi:hypothetical protein
MTEDEFEKLRKESGLGPTSSSKRAARSGAEEHLRKEQLRKKWETIQAAPPPATPADPATAAKVELLGRLLDVAARTYGAEVWRALFAEVRLNLLAGLPPVCEYVPPTDAERARMKELMRGYVDRPHDTLPATEARRGDD